MRYSSGTDHTSCCWWFYPLHWGNIRKHQLSVGLRTQLNEKRVYMYYAVFGPHVYVYKQCNVIMLVNI